ncbi:HEXXH motif-containing putative peptide modification protein [Actinoplanes oblitus]|uniref:HEXXH motif-containing putative peptide modification protein n=1 Tax=Actinoplanes oblitus TaxID=3040509 RepID=A0ABY8WJ46_9ACTN|nr:HEXXH motif-containing putative peptide modification protein [Actinoplanes oblitus]WIM97894.1 HEXXH motif-containing putative peptide modification protein [Actinoplanes oblitus]
MGELRSAERSWRMIVLSLLLDALGGDTPTGELAPAADAWQLVVAADRAASAAADDVLMRPPVGIWAAHMLRRIQRSATGPVPLWVEAGYLHALAAAAAIRAGLSFELTVPARHGVAVLPTLGHSVLPVTTPWSTVRVTCRDGVFEVRTTDGASVGPGTPAWRDPVIVTATADGQELTVELMDCDPYRDLRGPTPPHPLPPAEIEHWQRLLTAAWSLLVREQPDRAPAIAATVRAFTPVEPRERFRHLSASGGEAFGNVLLSDLDDPVDLAVTLVHEAQHQKLGALLHLLTLSDEDPGHRYYAPWRDDPRPLGGLLQGVYAFAAITEFWGGHRSPEHAALAAFELALWRGQTAATIRTLLAGEQLTSWGRRFVEHLREPVAACLRRPVPEHVDRLARLAALDHQAMWRGHHLVVEPATVAALAQAWRHGAPAPAVPADSRVTTSASPEVGRFDTRAVLIRYLLTDPDRLRRLRDDPELLATAVTGAQPADADLIRGDRAAAAVAYAGLVTADPASVHGWVGLGLALSDQPDSAAARALLSRPELVRAVACRLATTAGPDEARPDPVRLAAWLGADLPAASPEMPVPAVWPVA